MSSTLVSRLQSLSPGGRWMALFVMARIGAVGIASTVLMLHRVTEYDAMLAWLVLVMGALTVVVAIRRPETFRQPAWWVLDVTVGLTLIYLSQDWRSPFYLLALTALAPPAATLPFRRALAFGAGFTSLYLGVALATGLSPDSFRSTVSFEVFVTHLALPGVVTVGLAYAADVLRRLEDEQLHARRLAVETERRRIAWELHDSAKQRLHAAHLVLSSLPTSEPLELALEQLQGAAGDMETSIAELRSPLEGRPLEVAMHQRADELRSFSGGVDVSVQGQAPQLQTVAASHAYRILAEAMTNAVRHAGATSVRVEIGQGEDGGLHATVCDDGRGMPAEIRPGANGLRTMRSRAFAIGGNLTIGSSDGSGHPGVRVCLDLPKAQPEPRSGSRASRPSRLGPDEDSLHPEPDQGAPA